MDDGHNNLTFKFLKCKVYLEAVQALTPQFEQYYILYHYNSNNHEIDIMWKCFQYEVNNSKFVW